MRRVKKSDKSNEEQTRQRLLEAAGQEFAERGFKDATVRDICNAAQANVAAVNYHFGDKKRLYSESIRYAHSCSPHVPLDETAGAKPEDRLRTFVRAMLAGVLDEGRPAWHGRLLAREMAEPTGVLQQIVANVIRPRFLFLSGIVRSYVGEDAPDALVARCARSIVGQVLFYHFARPLLLRAFVDEKFDSSAVDTLADHIVAFSIGGLEKTAVTMKRSRSTSRPKG
jgi:AcrR family transcriptional regulator